MAFLSKGVKAKMNKAAVFRGGLMGPVGLEPTTGRL